MNEREDKGLKSRVRPRYIALRNCSSFSLLQSSMSIKNLVTAAKEQKMQALGLCDRGHLFGALEFAFACKDARMQPIIGCSLTLSADSDFSFAVFAKNDAGYSNLCKLVTMTTVGQGNNLREKITLNQIEGHTEGLLCLSGSESGFLYKGLLDGKLDSSLSILDEFQKLFPSRLYIEIFRDGRYSPNSNDVEKQVLQIAYERKLPVIASNEALFLTPDDFESTDTLSCIADGKYVQDPDRKRLEKWKYFRSSEEMEKLFEDIPEALQNTVCFAERCGFLLKSKPPVLPSFQCELPQTDELIKRSERGLCERLEAQSIEELENRGEKEAGYVSRLRYETEMICKLGFAGYFLIVSDFIRWAKSQKIPVGPGRGSGASSLVAWSLFITDVDPIRFGLLFERFLNPERVSMPDFDVDFCQDRRDEVIDYVRKKYGEDRVAHIITFGSLQARAVVRDVGRVLQMPYKQVDGICKLIPQNPAHPINLSDALKMEPILREMEKNDEQIAYMMKVCLRLEGLYRHASVHAAGVVVGSEPLCNSVPLYKDENSALPATEFSMKYIEKAGLIKFDFLGLKTLTIIQNAINMAEKNGTHIDITNIPLDDAKTFDLLRNVETVGIFQLEGSGISSALRNLQPDHFEEIIALGALYRPGPMDEIPRYVACRHGREAISYAYPELEPILRETFGVIVYQEQVLQIARILAGYSMGGADILRRAMGKKIKSEMDSQRKTFIDGVLKHTGGTIEKAERLFDQIEKFAEYAFPKAHATPYALLTYQTAYLKANHPIEFLTSLMEQDIANSDKLSLFTREAKRIGINILPPNINISKAQFSIESSEKGDKCIRYALAAIKNVGAAAMEKLCFEREKNGKFSDIFDFLERVDCINKKNMESLIEAGVFDCLCSNRRKLMDSLDLLLSHSSASNKTSDELSLFSQESIRPQLQEIEDWSPHEKLLHEFQAIGFYLTAHPLEDFCKIEKNFVFSSDICEFLEKNQTNKPFSMIGVVIDVKEKVSKAGNKYAFINLSDPKGHYEVVAFSDVLGKFTELLKVGKFLHIVASGYVEEDSPKLTVQIVNDLNEMMEAECDMATIDITNEYQLVELKNLLSELPQGNCDLVLALYEKGKKKTIMLRSGKRISRKNLINITSKIYSMRALYAQNSK
ncbi:DNA polymerase III subunit alpha [Candidatus Hydrogenosomobacter endosymbioticus]|nr:DNA polymerase III subunit alpha [Candidatus Hydrogenosomobacter endosymbioticus]